MKLISFIITCDAALYARRSCFANAILAAFVLFAAAFLSGCAAMANPDDSDLPWAETPEWELTPNLPSSMMNQ